MFVRKSSEGRILGFSPHPMGEDSEEVADNDPRIVALVQRANLVTPALRALNDSDLIVLRCFEKDIPVPVEWRTYRQNLRDILKGRSTAATLPVAPVKPVGL
jgi:hypothetical protein